MKNTELNYIVRFHDKKLDDITSKEGDPSSDSLPRFNASNVSEFVRHLKSIEVYLMNQIDIQDIEGKKEREERFALTYAISNQMFDVLSLDEKTVLYEGNPKVPSLGVDDIKRDLDILEELSKTIDVATVQELLDLRSKAKELVFTKIDNLLVSEISGQLEASIELNKEVSSRLKELTKEVNTGLASGDIGEDDEVINYYNLAIKVNQSLAALSSELDGLSPA